MQSVKFIPTEERTSVMKEMKFRIVHSLDAKKIDP